MKFIENLSTETVKMLERIYRQSTHHQVRQRAHCILLSFQGFTMAQLTTIFNVSRKTIHNWFVGWEQAKLVGLYDEPGRGRKRLFDSEQIAQIREWVKQNPKNLKKVLAQIEQEWEIKASRDTLKRVLKSVGMTWRRVRRIVAGAPEPQEYEDKQAQLETLKQLDTAGEIDLRYLDESGFCLVPYVPYAWQDKTDGIEVPSQRSPRLNVVGLLNRRNQLESYVFTGTITSEIIIAVLDCVCQTLTQRTVVVMDQASVHTSKAFEQKQSEWEAQQLEIFWLPTYSPQLNLIEILWRFIKYEWLGFDAYQDWKTLVQSVEDILKGVGEKYVINFA
jgi:transposase